MKWLRQGVLLASQLGVVGWKLKRVDLNEKHTDQLRPLRRLHDLLQCVFFLSRRRVQSLKGQTGDLHGALYRGGGRPGSGILRPVRRKTRVCQVVSCGGFEACLTAQEDLRWMGKRFAGQAVFSG